MKFLLRYWYIIVLAFVFSLAAAIGSLFLRKDKWLKSVVETEVNLSDFSDLTSMSKEYLQWNYDTTSVEEMRVKLESELAKVDFKRGELEVLRTQVNSEVEELNELRREIDALRATVNQEFFAIEDSEKDNLKRLAKVYENMKPVPVVELFKGIEIELVVKIMSQISEEAAAKILAEMTNENQGPQVLSQAVTITESLRKIKK
jgi:flagellar motility protein MotE (MotC chaperone)